MDGVCFVLRIERRLPNKDKKHKACIRQRRVKRNVICRKVESIFSKIMEFEAVLRDYSSELGNAMTESTS